MNRWERKCENRSKSRRREADKRRWSQIGKSHRRHWGALLTTGRAPPTSQGQGFISERNGPSTKYQSSWASFQVAKTKFVQQVLCSAVSLNVSTPDQKAQSHSAVYSNKRRARFTMDFTTYDERCWFAASQSYLCPGIYSKITKTTNRANQMMNQVMKRGKAKVAVAGDYIKAGVRSDRLPFDSFCSVLQQQLSSLCTTMCQAYTRFY